MMHCSIVNDYCDRKACIVVPNVIERQFHSTSYIIRVRLLGFSFCAMRKDWVRIWSKKRRETSTNHIAGLSFLDSHKIKIPKVSLEYFCIDHVSPFSCHFPCCISCCLYAGRCSCSKCSLLLLILSFTHEERGWIRY